MKIAVHHRCDDFSSYRAARVKSLFNVESGANFQLDADLDLDSAPWQIGVIVGPSGSGKTSMGRSLWGGEAMYAPAWPQNQPIIDAILPAGKFDDVTAALSSVGLGSVPTWLRPFGVLSNGEQFRANLARLIAEAPDRAVLDEFSSVVDRQIARIGAGAFAKAWRRTEGRAVLLSCHYDILDWVQPDWVFDTATGQFQRGWLRRRPRIDVDLWQCGWEHWPAFEPHHYLKLPHMIAATNYVATVDNQLVAHVAVSTRSRAEARACRLVVMPEWQGAGVGLRFLDAVCELWRTGVNRYSRPMPALFHTSHPGLAGALRRSSRWTQVSAKLTGENKARSRASMLQSASRNGLNLVGAGYGGHFRAVQGFRYLGVPPCAS
ncbi:GNAT family N-acetyltransferase [Acidovorax sp. GBBC 3332]|nr:MULTISPECIES: GNAT family N-acetyltransferase [unclassified Acidovorax]MDA8449856.1 GNAT family N-acetyltransferase [Acidovorax sp. GBBC 3297]MDA8459301.1 GNAT family N-acetyltransferase [Acidovorax sp. GBBC 3333]MDA8464338.1 GNAT family N-acetyltransferase [Acidovorax sp. GBBC 3332]MDA8469451.1 GNAT family N-acetyltransferase [Acidovorax sp. GBBC 3299]